MKRDKLIIDYKDKIKHDQMIVNLLRHMPLNVLVKFRVSFFLGGDELGLTDNKWHQVPGDVLAIPVKFNKASVLIDLLTSEHLYPMISSYQLERLREGAFDLRKALDFRWILGWEELVNYKDELPLHIGAQVKTKLFEQYLKGV